MTTNALSCWNCGHSLADVPRPISRHEQCAACFEALHCCRLCRHYRADPSNQCDEERADPPVVKENANFCDWFRPDAEAFAGARVAQRNSAQDKLDALFRGGAGQQNEADPDDSSAADARPPSREDEARSKLDDLFSKD